MSTRLAVLVIGGAGLAGLAALTWWAPGYLTTQGFPLDDAWIHAVYGREIARSGMLAYNPGTPATGSTAPLWSAVVGLLYLLAGGGAPLVLGVKLCGFLFHVSTALMLFAALRDRAPSHERWSLAGAVLVALHPDLVAASVSGMEVSLAGLAAVSLLYAAARGGVVRYTALAAAAFLIRPELAVVSLSIALLHGAAARAHPLRLVAGAVTGSGLALGLLAARNWSVSGLPLPATFYAKVGHGPELSAALRLGFAGLLRQLVLVDSLLLLGAMLGIAVILLRARPGRGVTLAAVSFVSGLAFCVVSFALVAPIDPGAFYHQRYVLPALPLLIGPLPLLFDEALARALPRHAEVGTGLIVALCLAALARSAGPRFAHLGNDARNIDDVQVALGKHLAAADPSDVVWAVDAGAVRYFGNAFVVDMLGLNTPELLGAHAQAYLDAHPPRYVEVVPSWSSLGAAADTRFRGLSFEPTTPYTVTGFPIMQRHVLVQCEVAAGPAHYGIRSRVFDLACAPGADATPLHGRRAS